MPFKEASMQHTTSCGQNILDTQVNGPYTASNEKKVLIKFSQTMKSFHSVPQATTCSHGFISPDFPNQRTN